MIYTLKLDSLKALDLINTSHNQDKQNVFISLTVGTERRETITLVGVGTEADFTDKLEFTFDSVDLNSTVVKVDVINKPPNGATKEFNTNKLIGFGRITLIKALPEVDEFSTFVVNLLTPAQYHRNTTSPGLEADDDANNMNGSVKIRGIIATEKYSKSIADSRIDNNYINRGDDKKGRSTDSVDEFDEYISHLRSNSPKMRRVAAASVVGGSRTAHQDVMLDNYDEPIPMTENDALLEDNFGQKTDHSYKFDSGDDTTFNQNRLVDASKREYVNRDFSSGMNVSDLSEGDLFTSAIARYGVTGSYISLDNVEAKSSKKSVSYATSSDKILHNKIRKDTVAVFNTVDADYNGTLNVEEFEYFLHLMGLLDQKPQEQRGGAVALKKYVTDVYILAFKFSIYAADANKDTSLGMASAVFSYDDDKLETALAGDISLNGAILLMEAIYGVFEIPSDNVRVSTIMKELRGRKIMHKDYNITRHIDLDIQKHQRLANSRVVRNKSRYPQKSDRELHDHYEQHRIQRLEKLTKETFKSHNEQNTFHPKICTLTSPKVGERVDVFGCDISTSSPSSPTTKAKRDYFVGTVERVDRNGLYQVYINDLDVSFKKVSKSSIRPHIYGEREAAPLYDRLNDPASHTLSCNGEYSILESNMIEAKIDEQSRYDEHCTFEPMVKGSAFVSDRSLRLKEEGVLNELEKAKPPAVKRSQKPKALPSTTTASFISPIAVARKSNHRSLSSSRRAVPLPRSSRTSLLSSREATLKTDSIPRSPTTAGSSLNAWNKELVFSFLNYLDDDSSILVNQLGGSYSDKATGFVEGAPTSAGIPLYFFDKEDPPAFELGLYLCTINVPKPVATAGDKNASNSANTTGIPFAPPLPDWAWGSQGDPSRNASQTGHIPFKRSETSGQKKEAPKATGWQQILEEMAAKRQTPMLKKAEPMPIEKTSKKLGGKRKPMRRQSSFQDVIEELSYTLAKLRGDIPDDDGDDTDDDDAVVINSSKTNSSGKVRPAVPTPANIPEPPVLNKAAFPGYKAPEPEPATVSSTIVPSLQLPAVSNVKPAVTSTYQDYNPHVPPPLPKEWPPVEPYGLIDNLTDVDVSMDTSVVSKGPSYSAESFQAAIGASSKQTISCELPLGYYLSIVVPGMIGSGQIVPGGVTTASLIAKMQMIYNAKADGVAPTTATASSSLKDTAFVKHTNADDTTGNRNSISVLDEEPSQLLDDLSQYSTPVNSSRRGVKDDSHGVNELSHVYGKDTGTTMMNLSSSMDEVSMVQPTAVKDINAAANMTHADSYASKSNASSSMSKVVSNQSRSSSCKPATTSSLPTPKAFQQAVDHIKKCIAKRRKAREMQEQASFRHYDILPAPVSTTKPDDAVLSIDIRKQSRYAQSLTNKDIMDIAESHRKDHMNEFSLHLRSYDINANVTYRGVVELINESLSIDALKSYHVKLLSAALSESAMGSLPRKAYSYLILIDAGLSSLVVHVHRYGRIGGTEGVITIVPQDKSKRIRHSNTTEATLDSYSEIVQYVKSEVPQKEWESTPLWMLGTVGLRSLNPSDGETILENARNYFTDKSKSPFMCLRSWAKIIASEEEKKYGWMDTEISNIKKAHKQQGTIGSNSNSVGRVRPPPPPPVSFNAPKAADPHYRSEAHERILRKREERRLLNIKMAQEMLEQEKEQKRQWHDSALSVGKKIGYDSNMRRSKHEQLFDKYNVNVMQLHHVATKDAYLSTYMPQFINFKMYDDMLLDKKCYNDQAFNNVNIVDAPKIYNFDHIV